MSNSTATALQAALRSVDKHEAVLDIGNSLASAGLPEGEHPLTTAVSVPDCSTGAFDGSLQEDLARSLSDAIARTRPDWILIGPDALRTWDVVDVFAAVSHAVQGQADRVGDSPPRLLLVAPNWASQAVVLWLVAAGDTAQAPHLELRGTPVTSRIISAAARTCSLREVASADIPVLLQADDVFAGQPIPRSSPVGRLIKKLQDSTGAAPAASYLVRTLQFCVEEPAAHQSVARAVERPFLSVIVRTQGRRPQMLLEALTCLAGQDDQDFEVLLMAHSDESEVLDGVADLVHCFDREFTDRVRVTQVVTGSRSGPLNAGLDLARGTYVAFLDDDELVTADWMSAFRSGAADRPGAVVRALVREQRIQEADSGEYQVAGPLEATYPDRYEHGSHLRSNSTPICSFALPLAYMHSTNARFDETLPVLEDWDMLVGAAEWCGVIDVPLPTSIYHRWQSGTSSRHSVPRREWIAASEEVGDKLAAMPLLFDIGSAPSIAKAFGSAHRVEAYKKWEKTVLAEQRRLQDEVAAQFEEIARLNVVIRDMTITRNLWTRLRYRLGPRVRRYLEAKSMIKKRDGGYESR